MMRRILSHLIASVPMSSVLYDRAPRSTYVISPTMRSPLRRTTVSAFCALEDGGTASAARATARAASVARTAAQSHRAAVHRYQTKGQPPPSPQAPHLGAMVTPPWWCCIKRYEDHIRLSLPGTGRAGGACRPSRQRAAESH